MKHHQPQTVAVRSGLNTDKHTQSLVPPMHLSTTYALQGLEQKGDFDYSRTNNPTRNLLAEALAKLEHGQGCVITNTGMSAILLVCQLLKHDDWLVIPHDCYGGSYRLFTHLAEKGAFQLKIIDQHDSAALAEALALKPKMIWVETPSNPVLRVYDIQGIAEQAKIIDALVVVDNTFLTPVFQQPLVLGADIVVHSCTKFINGHSDIVCGAVIAKEQAIAESLSWWANCIGVTGSAFDSYMVLRGLRTLPTRMHVHESNSYQIVELLEQHPKISRVHYPGLASHPNHELAQLQQTGFGAIVSFELRGGKAAVAQLLQHLTIFTQAQSLGGVESLINHPATMTHAAMPDAAKLTAGVTDGLLRLAVGIESINDLLADLDNALAQIDQK